MSRVRGAFARFVARWRPDPAHVDTPQGHRRRIFNTAALALTVVAAITGVAGFALQLNSVTQNAHEHLSRALSDRRLVLQEALSNAADKALLVGSNPLVINALLKDSSGAGLRLIAESLLHQGFSHVALESPTGTLSLAGRFMGRPSLEVPIQGRLAGSLAWRDGYVVRHRQAIQGAQGVAVYLLTEQPLTVLALLSTEVKNWGTTFDMGLCADGGHDRINCFPQRVMREVFSMPKSVKGQPLSMALALAGQTGVTARLDFRQHQVVAAYAPVGSSGLGMVLKVDSDELYAPARQQFLVALPVIALTVLAGLWALRLRLRPMVQALIQTRQKAQANEARFIAAMESGLDAFFILRAERNSQGVIVDFRFTYVTVRGAALISRSLSPAQVEGQLLCELLPVNRTHGLFDKFKGVVETGVPLAEEFPIEQAGVLAIWISHQVVRMGDDSIAITSRDVSERKQAQEAIRQSEELLRLVTDNVPALIAYLDEGERFLFINRGGAELYGRPVQDIVGKTVLEVVGPQNYAAMQAPIATVRTGQAVTYERELMRADGVRHLLSSYFPRLDEHGDVHVCVLTHDITARKQMEEALATSQARLKEVTDNVPALISYIDTEHRFRFANRAYQDWLGVDPQGLIGRSLLELYGDEAYAGIRPYLERALAGEVVLYERDLLCLSGVRQVQVTMSPHRNHDDKIVGLYVLMNDIGALKQAEKLSARSEERLTLALEGSHLALFDWDLTRQQVFHSAHWASMLGGPAQQSTISLALLSQLVHPDDLPMVMAKVSDAVKGVVPFYSAEHRVRTSTGQWLWILSRGRVVERDANGRAIRLSGTNADITEQKALEVQLQRLAELDTLTGLPNRALFNDRLQSALARGGRHASPVALLLLDIDYFKQINDSLGHDAGDAVLQEFGRRLLTAVRLTDTVARLGGDEFSIILQELHSVSEVEMIAAKVVAAMAEDFVHAGQSLRVTTSVGVAYLGHPTDEAPASLIKLADQALYAAKSAGRNNYQLAEMA
ncbi:MAG: diguanylate cyclase [Massilia sp.]|nr:diguanylate cyclase [Aquabacterium sp.]